MQRLKLVSYALTSCLARLILPQAATAQTSRTKTQRRTSSKPSHLTTFMATLITSVVVSAVCSSAAFALTNTELPSATPLAGWSNWREGQIFEAKVGKWSGAQPVTYSYQWERCNSEGSACTNIKEATSASYTTTSEDVSHTLRVVVTAKNSEGTKAATSAAGSTIAAQTGPEAHIVNSSGHIVQSYGAAYATEEGGQIQRAENFAHHFGYNKVTLDAGTFAITKWVHVLFESKTKSMSTGVFLYSTIALEGSISAASTIKLEENLGGYSTALFVGVNPEDGNEAGNSLDISHITVYGNSDSPDGLIVGPESGPGMFIEHITVEGNAGVLLGDSEPLYGGQLHGEAGSPMMFAHNSVLGSAAKASP